MVICADKRTNFHGEKGFTADDAEKIHRIHRTATFATHGAPNVTLRYINDETGQVVEGKTSILFDADVIIEKFFQSHSAKSITGNYRLLFQKLQNEFEENVVNGGFVDKLTFAGPPEYLLFQTTFFRVVKSGEITVFALTARHNNPDDPGFRLFFEKRDDNPFAIKPMSYGFFYVANEIETGHDPRFDIYRRTAIVKRLLLEFANPAFVSIDDALLLAKEIFTATYKEYAIVKSPLSNMVLAGSPISNTMDAAVISYDEGFRWLKREWLFTDP